MTFRVFHFVLQLMIFLVIDLLWLGVIARDFYNRQLGALRSPQTNWAAASVFYLLFNVGLMWFAVQPGLDAGGVGTALVRGSVYGLITYSTYDLTNLATLRDWPWKMSLVDILWGVVLCASVSVATVGLIGFV